MAANPFEHVQDDIKWAVFRAFEPALPVIHLGFYDLQITKFMLLELVAAGLMLAVFIPLSRRAASSDLPRGPWWNAFEGLLTFVRDEIAKPNLGEHDADQYVPFLWTMFLFILFCNLLGMIPFGFASPTASIWVTGGLAVCSFVMLHGAAIVKMGPIHYLKSLWPHIEIGESLFARIAGFIFSLVIFVIELGGTVIKSGVLAIRLFANMFAGHTVLAVILGFILLAGANGFSMVWPVVTVASVLGVAALSLLELFVAFLQAYVFVFLTALFMGMSLHPSH
jgi:F-type H+-transporting ATPase subunit a